MPDNFQKLFELFNSFHAWASKQMADLSSENNRLRQRISELEAQLCPPLQKKSVAE